MTTRTILIDGVSIARYASKLRDGRRNNNKADPVVEAIVGHIRDVLKRHSPSFAVALFPNGEVLTPEELEPIIALTTYLGVTTRTVPADTSGPTLSALTRQMSTKGPVLVSGRGISLAQLVDKNTNLLHYGTGATWTEDEILSELGISCKQVPDLVALTGDPDQQVPGLIGGKTAVNLIKTYGSISGVINSSEKLPRAVQLLIDSRKSDINERFRISSYTERELESVDVDPSSIARKKVNARALYEAYIKYKMYDWLPSELKEKYAPKTNYGSENTYTHVINSEKSAGNFLNQVKNKKGCAVLVDESSKFATISFQEGEAWHVNLGEDSPWATDCLKHILESNEVKIVTHEAKRLYKWCKRHGIEMRQLASDSAILAYTIDTQNSEKTLSDLSDEHLGINISNNGDMFGENEGQFSQTTGEGKFGEEADICWRLNRHLYRLASIDRIARVVFERYELPIIKIISEMESEGAKIDINALNEQSVIWRKRLSEIQKSISELAGENINISSPQQVAGLLYDNLKLEPSTKKSGGKRSTSEDVLSQLSEEHEAPGLILEYRKLSTLLSHFVEPLKKKVDSKSGRIHSTLMQNVTSTGRLSSRDPNLQNLPIRTDEGKKIRRAFIADEGSLILAADYSQIELRILAHLSGDQGLAKAFSEGTDIHISTASEVFNVPIGSVTGEQRRYCKAINYGLIYGLSAFGLAKKIGADVDTAQKYINKYFDTYPGVKAYLEKTIRQAKKDGYVQTISGRKIYIPNVNSDSHAARGAAERAVTNAPMQGSASDIIKLAMIAVANRLEKNDLKAKLLMQVHDELVLEVGKNDVQETMKMVKEAMENAYKLNVPLEVNADIGKNWEQSHRIEAHEEDLESEYSVDI